MGPDKRAWNVFGHTSASLRSILMSLLTAVLLVWMGSPVCANSTPNIIFILGDDQAWWDYSFMYRANVEKTAIDLDPAIHQVAETPNIDRLADEGLTFTHGYTTPLCRPSLASMITGTLPRQHYITGNDLVGRVPDAAVEYRLQVMQSLPRILSKRLGYTSFQTGKWWEGHHSNGGFTSGDTVNSTAIGLRPSQWSGSRPSYAPARHGDWGLMIGRVDYVNGIESPAHPINYANTVVPVTDFIDAEVAADQPFFVWYAPFLPHTPHDPPAGLLSKYDPLVDENNESGDPIAKYYANIERFDGGVGAILDHLDATGIADETIVVMICDNGWITTDSGTFASKSKRSPYEGGARTPIIVRWPDRIKVGGDLPPQIITQPVSVVDLVPTVLHALDLEPSPEMCGIDLLDLIAVNARDTIYGEAGNHDIQDLPDPSQSLEARFAIRDGWKLISFSGGSNELYQLYDQQTDAPIDPFETNNVAGVEAQRTSELSTAIEVWYGEDKDLHWRHDVSQTRGSALVPLTGTLGQTFTASTNGFLSAIRVVLRSTAPAPLLRLELRELDAQGAPTGNLLGASPLPAASTVPGELRRILFPFQEPVGFSAGQAVGFQLVSGPAAGGFELAYLSTNAYAGGQMVYDGLLEGEPSSTGSLDLAFETFYSAYDLPGKLQISHRDGVIRVESLMGVKGVTATLLSSSDLGSWSEEATDANLDGLVSWTPSAGAPRNTFRLGLEVVGEMVTLQSLGSELLYEETFTGTGTNLNGLVPSTSINSNAWTAPANGAFTDDGLLPTGDGGSAYLPFVPEHGSVYTLSVEMTQDAADQDRWIAFGFMGEPPSTSQIHQGDGVLWALTRNWAANDNQVLHENASGGTGSVQRGSYVTGAATVPMSLVLDTTGGPGSWTYDWVVDGTVEVSDRLLGSAFESVIGAVGISKISGSTAKTFESFRLNRE